MLTCRDCYWVGEEEELISCSIQIGADIELTCPDCESDWIEPLEEVVTASTWDQDKERRQEEKEKEWQHLFPKHFKSR